MSRPMSVNVREAVKETALTNALRKRQAGVPTYSVSEAAALLSISQEYLYRLIQSGGFPAVHMRIGAKQGRYVVPAKAIDQLLAEAVATGECLDAETWTQRWSAQQQAGGAA